jgi:hypothetical protein
VTKIKVLDRMIAFIGTLVTNSLNHTYYSALANLHSLHFTVAHALRFSVFTSRLLATDFNTGSITVSPNYTFLISMHYNTCNVTH